MRRGLPLLATAAFPVALVAAPAAADETRASADASAGVGWSSNPFQGVNGAGGGNGSGFGQLGISPRVQILNERRTITLGGDLFYQTYFRDYSDTATYQAYADYADRISETSSVHGRVGYSSARLGTFGFGGLAGPVGGTLNPVVTGPVLDPSGAGAGIGLANPGLVVPIIPGAEVGAFGVGQRQRTFNASGDASTALSERMSLTGSAFFIATRFGGVRSQPQFGQLGDYNGYGSTLGLNRQLSERTTVGLQGSVSRYDYDGALFDSRVYSLQATLSTRLSELWTLDGALGVSYLDQTFGKGATLSGNANLCRRGERTSTCFQAARAVLPTGFAGTRTQTSAGVTWAMQVGEFQNLSLAASYVDLSGGTDRVLLGGGLTAPGLFNLDDQYALATAGYSRALSRRFRLNPSVYYRKVFGGSVQRDDDYGGQISLSYRLGDIR